MSMFPLWTVLSRHKVGSTSSKEHVLKVMADFPDPPYPLHILHLNLWKLQFYKPPEFFKAVASFEINVNTFGTIASFRYSKWVFTSLGLQYWGFSAIKHPHTYKPPLHTCPVSLPPLPVPRPLPLSEDEIFTAKATKICMTFDKLSNGSSQFTSPLVGFPT